MGPPVETVGRFIREWLAGRSRDPSRAAAVTAAGLIGPVAERMGRGPDGIVLAERFLDALAPRLATVVDLSRRCGGGDGRDPAAPAWKREARRLAESWNRDDPDSWWTDLLDLAASGNGLIQAIVAGCLDDALDPTHGPRPVLPNLRKLRALDETPYRHLPVPPSPGAPWDAADYLVPPQDADRIEMLVAVLAAFDPDHPSSADLTPLEASRRAGAADAWHDSLAGYHAGWPVARSRLRAALAKVAALWPDAPPELAATIEAWSPPDARPAEPSPAASLQPSTSADPVAALAAALEADADPEAQAFGRRLLAVVAAGGAERARLVLGALIYLDECEGPNRKLPGWATAVRAPLRAVAHGLEGCEVLDHQLIGRPVRHLADLVTAVGLDDRATPGASYRVTVVERPGYALRFTDGSRQILARAQVRLGL